MKTRISTYQTTLLLIITVLATSIVFLPALMAGEAMQNAWLSALLLILFAFGSSIIYILLAKRMGNQDLINFTRRTIGNLLTFPLTLGLVVYFIAVCSLVIRNNSEILVAVYFPDSPLWFFNLVSLLTTAALVYYGLEVIARSLEIFFYLFLVSFLAAILLLLPDLSTSFLQPFLEKGITPVLKGTYPGLVYFGEFFLVLIFAPQMKQINEVPKALGIAITITGGLFMLTILTTTMLFGAKLTANLTFPLLSAHRYAEAFNVLERLDPLFIFYWIGSGIFKAALFLYGGVYTGQKLLKRPTYQILIPFLLPIIYYFSFYYFENVAQINDFIYQTVPYLVGIQLIYPLILLIISAIRGIQSDAAT